MTHAKPATTTGAPLLRVEEAAVAVGVSAATVRRWCAAGYLVGVTLPRGGLRIRADSLSRLMGDHRRQP